MNHASKQPRVLGWFLVVGILTSAAFVGCATHQDEPQAAAGYDVMAGAADLPEGAMRGAQLWANNCIRCHNIRPPKAHSDKQWEIIMMHMRVRAGLTGEEQRQILTFLKAAN